MTRETIFCVLLVNYILYRYDIFLLHHLHSMSDRYDFICLNLIVLYYLAIYYNFFVPYRKKDLSESVTWIIFIIMVSSSSKNILKEMIGVFDFLFLSVIFFYVVFVTRLIYIKNETNVFWKILIVFLIVLKILWPGILYTWPYRCDYPDDFFDDCYSEIPYMND